MEQVLSLFCLLLSANLDTVLLSMNWTLAKRRIPRWGVVLIAGVTSAVTMLSLLAGNLAGAWFNGQFAHKGSGLLLMGMGLWAVLDWLRVEEQAKPAPSHDTLPGSLGQTLVLALALGVNNCGIGVGAGLAGYAPLVAGGINFLLTLAALPLGQFLGKTVQGSKAERWALLAGGAVLILGGAVAAQG